MSILPKTQKFFRASAKSSITSYPTPAEPFEVWEIDLYGPLPLSKQGSSYIFSAIDMLSKYVVAYSIKGEDAMTVPQQFTPAFMHHCLGACERVHATLAERLTPYMTSYKSNWE